MQKGFNSNLVLGAKSYHIQTEDWGQDNPYLMTRVFEKGALVLTLKESYDELFTKGEERSSSQIDKAMRSQHNRAAELLQLRLRPKSLDI